MPGQSPIDSDPSPIDSGPSPIGAGGLGQLVRPAFADRIVAYHADGPDWLGQLPDLIARCAKQWKLTVLSPYDPGGEASWTAPVRLHDGSSAVLQITVPSAVVTDAASALRAWDGCGAIRLYAEEPEIHAALLERCVPGTHAADMPTRTADEIASDLLPQLWSTGARALTSVPPLAEICRLRNDALTDRATRFAESVDVAPLWEAADLYGTLLASTATPVLLHGDFHRRNVLLSERGWLATDPTPYCGDATFDLVTYLQHDMDDPATIGRAEMLSDRLGLDRERSRAWLFVAAMQRASWLLSVGESAAYDIALTAASTLR